MSNTFNNKTVLITGGAGFIGSNIAFYLQNNFSNARVLVFDKFRNEETFSNGNLKSFGHFKNLIGFKGEIICGDISNSEDILKLDKYDIDFIFHEAAISDTTVLDQTSMIDSNVNSFIYILDLAKKKNARVIYASSGATYGNMPSPQTVGFENPENVYGFSKLMMENIARRYMKDVYVVGLRYFNVYGKNEFYKNKTASMILQLGLQILDKKEPRLFYNSENIFRDFVYIEDVVLVNIKAALVTTSRSGCVYNVGTGIARSFQDIVDILQNELKTDYKTQYFENPYKAYQNHTQANIDSTHVDLQYSPKFSLELGIKDYIDEIKRVHEEIKNA